MRSFLFFCNHLCTSCLAMYNWNFWAHKCCHIVGKDGNLKVPSQDCRLVVEVSPVLAFQIIVAVAVYVCLGIIMHLLADSCGLL